MLTPIIAPFVALALLFGISQKHPARLLHNVPERCATFDGGNRPENKAFCDAWTKQAVENDILKHHD